MNKKAILLIALYIAVPAALAWVGYVVGRSQILTVEHESILRHTGSAETTYYELPRISSSQVSEHGGNASIKLTVDLEVKKDDLQRVADYEPYIVERIITCLRGPCFADAQEHDQLRQMREDLSYAINTGTPLPFHILNLVISEVVLD